MRVRASDQMGSTYHRLCIIEPKFLGYFHSPLIYQPTIS